MTDESAPKKPAQQERRKRYRQEPERSAELRPQPRDKEIVSGVHKYRYMTTEGILKLFAPQGKGERAIRRRLTLLFHRGYLSRLFLYPLDRPGGVRFSKVVYIVDSKGGDLIFGKPDKPGEPTWKSGPEGHKIARRKRIKHQHLQHSLSISEFQLALELALKERGDVKLESFISDMEDKDMKAVVEVAPPGTDAQEAERRGELEKVTLWPDASFSIVSGGKRYFYFLEVDHADRKKDRILKRFRAYWQYVVGDREELRKKRGVSGAFVVFMAPGEKRRAELIELANQLPEIRRRRPGFWFVNLADVSLAEPGRILDGNIAYGLDGQPGFLTKF